MSIPTDVIFTLTINGHDEQLNCRAFAKLSRKARSLARDMIYSATIDRQVSAEAESAFLAACRVEQFKITTDCATDLLILANEWMIDTLESFVLRFMKSKSMNTDIELPNSDYLGQLLELADDHAASDFLFEQVAKRLNGYFDDERLLDLNPESLFRVVILAEEFGLSEEKFRDFLFRLFRHNVYSAVPLTLRLNFAIIQQAQDRQIYETPEMHDQNMGYFKVLALSALRNRSDRERIRFVKAIQIGIQQLQSDLRNQRHNDAHALHTEFKDRTNKMKAILAEQKRQLDEIKEYREEQMKRHDEELLNFTKNADELRELMSKQKRDLMARIKAMEQLKNEVKDEIDRNLHGLRNKIAKDLKDVTKEAEKRQATIADAIKEPLENLTQNVDEAKGLIEDLNNQVNDHVNDARDKQTVLATKMMRDFMRFDGFVRRTGKRFQLFEDMNVWGLKPDDIKDSEKFLNNLERSLDRLCPIRRNVSQ